MAFPFRFGNKPFKIGKKTIFCLGVSMSVKVNDYNFKNEVLESKIPVLVDFGAEWCQPCKRLDPILEQLALQWKDQVHVVKVDVDESGGLAMQMQVMSVPTMILFVNGSETSRMVGLQSPEKITQKISEKIGVLLS
jgi:thioredoxin 1